MRKFIAASIGTITAATAVATMAFSAPAQAATGPVGNAACLALPALIATATGAQATASLNDSNANADYSSKNAALNVALATYVSDAIAWINATDSGVGVALAKSTLDGASADVGTKAAAWSASKSAQFAADVAMSLATINLTALTQMSSGLCS